MSQDQNKPASPEAVDKAIFEALPSPSEDVRLLLLEIQALREELRAARLRATA